MPKGAINGPQYQEIERSIHVAEVDLAYAQYFPTEHKRYQCLFPKGVPATENFGGPRPPLWKVVEKWMEDDKLQAFKDGYLDAELAEQGLTLQPLDSASGAPNQPGIDEQGQKSPHTQQSFQGLPPDRNNHVPFYVQLSPDPELASGQHYDSDKDDDAVMLNVETNEQESGEVSEIAVQAVSHSKDGAEGDPLHIRGYAVNDVGNTSEDLDAMADYADASQALGPPEPRSPKLEGQAIDGRRPTYLSDLGEQDLDAQLLYFYITQDPQNLDFKSIPVRCLVCARAGHMAPECPTLTCADCGSYNDHFVPFCPHKRKCSKCRGQGHDSAKCPSKLKLAASEIICDLCQEKGHTEHNCELLWRTSGPPKPLNKSDKRWKYIYCYECGGPQHLGNDCPTRRPGKPMGTATWSLKGNALPAGQSHNKSKAGLTIRGRAQQHQPELINISSDSDGDTQLVRSKLPVPTNKGLIRIAVPGRTGNQHPRQTYNNEPYVLQQIDDSDTGNAQYIDDYRQAAASQRYFDSRHDRPYMYPGHPRTSSRPNLSYQPPPPPRRHPDNPKYSMRSNAERGDTYRPMPSAGQNAWRQYRR